MEDYKPQLPAFLSNWRAVDQNGVIKSLLEWETRKRLDEKFSDAFNFLKRDILWAKGVGKGEGYCAARKI
jgi:hypothetical protein